MFLNTSLINLKTSQFITWHEEVQMNKLKGGIQKHFPQKKKKLTEPDCNPVLTAINELGEVFSLFVIFVSFL